jgi:hypothetical protein
MLAAEAAAAAADRASLRRVPQVLCAIVHAAISLPTWVMLKDADGALVVVGLTRSLEEGDCVDVRCCHGAVHALHQLPHTGANAPVAVKVHSVGLGQVTRSVCYTLWEIQRMWHEQRGFQYV